MAGRAGGRGDTDPADIVAAADRVNVALVVVLDTLSPAERIAFVLHDVFGQPFDEIALVLDKTPDAARQLCLASDGAQAARRARTRPPRTERFTGGRVVEAWLAAAQGGDLRALLTLLDDSAVLHADYGRTSAHIEGAREASPPRPHSRRGWPRTRHRFRSTACPGVAAVLDGRVVSLMAFEIEGDRIIGLSVLADPEATRGARRRAEQCGDSGR